MRGNLDEQLQELRKDLLKMGSLMEEAISKAIKSLATQDLQLAREVVVADAAIDRFEENLEARCLNILALQNPVATDLREITTTLKIITDLERMADEAVNIAEVTIMIGTDPLLKPLEDIPVMAQLAIKMVAKCLDAFVNRNLDLAKEVAASDTAVDRLYSQLFAELTGLIVQHSPFPQTEQAIELIFTARYLERIADHATNIAERTIYMVTGQRVSHRREWWKEN